MTEINSDNNNSCSNQQRILITGVSGLVGRVLFHYLMKTYPTKYQVFGLDQHTNVSTRYKPNETHLVEAIKPIPSDKFFQCDITDRTKLFQIIEEQKIDFIIHLAAVLEMHPDIQKISDVNINGTKNIFEAPGVRRIIFASSVMVVFGYTTREPYLSIRNETFDDETMLKNLRKLTAADDPPLPETRTPGIIAYCQSKIIGEQMAMDIAKNSSKSIICARFGAVNTDDQPDTNWYRTLWLSHRDVCSFIDKALHAPLNVSGIYFVTSKNHRHWMDLDHPEKDLGFVPQDGADKFIA